MTIGVPVVCQLIKSGAVVYQAPVGTGIPAITTVTYGTAWAGGWLRVGYTKAPLAVSYESDEHDMEVEEVLAAIERVRVGEKFSAETTLAELTADYLQLANSEAMAVTVVAPGAGTAGYERTGLGGTVTLAKHAWGIEGRYIDAAGNILPIRMYIWKATGKLNGKLEFSWKNKEYTGIGLQILALADPTQTTGEQLVRFDRVTAP